MRTPVGALFANRITKLAAGALVLIIVGATATLAARSGDVATAAEVLSTVLSALALAGVAAALYYQALQTEITRLDVARNQRADLMLFAIEHPSLIEAWGYKVDDPEVAKLQVYASIVFAYLAMAFEVRRITRF